MKRIIAAILASVMFISAFCSCSKTKGSYALTVNGVKITREVYNYYLAKAEYSPEFADEKDKKQTAAELCAEFAAGNELIGRYGITLSAEEKVEASAKLRGLWQYNSDFYKNHGVSKQTVGAMTEYDMLVDNLTASGLLTGQSYENVRLKAEDYFYKNYIAVSMIYSPFTDKKGAALKESEQKKLTRKFTEMRNLVRRGSSMALAAARYPDIAKYDENVTDIICADDRGYPERMFNDVSKISIGTAQVYKYSDGLYLILKLNIKDKEKNYFERYTKECILKLFGSQTEKTINALAQSYEIVYN